MDRAEQLTQGLEKKGWTAPEVAAAQKIYQEAPKKRADYVKLLDAILYWVLLGVTIIANFIVSIVLVPFLLVLTGIYVHIALVFAGLVFGTLMDVVIREQESMQQKHFIIAELFIPILALLNIYIITRLSNQLAVVLHQPGATNPFIAAVVYVIGFSFPHVFFKLTKHSKTSAVSPA